MLKIIHREMLGERIGQDLIHVDCYSITHKLPLLGLILIRYCDFTSKQSDDRHWVIKKAAPLSDVDCGRQI